MEKLCLDTNGVQRPSKDYDYHHVIPRSKAHGIAERDFIKLDGLLLPIFKEYHNVGALALHRNVGLCPMPSRELRYEIRNRLYEEADMQKNNGEPHNPYDLFLQASIEVQALADYSANPVMRKDATRVARNFIAQTPYILGGMVREL